MKKKTTYSLIVLLGIIILATLYIGFHSFSKEKPTEIAFTSQETPNIYPDYKEVNIPYNIAPLNFRIDDDIDKSYVQVTDDSGSITEFYGENHIEFPEGTWKKILQANKGKSLSISVATKKDENWTQWASFPIFINDQAIDSHLVYRLIEPGYEKWHIIGIYQRNLESFEETPIIKNNMTGYNCINCHSFCMNDPNQMMFHMRATHGGTYVIQDEKISKLNTKTEQTISNMTYPFWHPSGNFITTSVNDIKQFFHSVKEKKMEVFDLESDVIVYDVQNKEILSKASLITKEHFETFPSFSPDGKWLYFCSTPAQEMPNNYDKVRYNLCRVAFDAEKKEFVMPIDTLVRADSLSSTMPRISPNGRFLMYTETAYGQFPIWHTGAELRMIDLENRQSIDMSTMNSPDTESYHSWSSNSQWVVFSTRRDNGLYTLPYICHIDKNGKPSKPFLLPQENPDTYDYLLYSYNIPELTTGPVEVSPYEIEHAAKNLEAEQIQFK